MTEKELLPREQAILTEIIEYYITNHESVSARTLSKISHLSLSPTTIRNLMEDLSDGGYLTRHGGARGRLPTRKAFYIYIGHVCGKKSQPRAASAEKKWFPLAAPGLESALGEVGAYLAAQTELAVVASLPPRERYLLDWMRLSAIDGGRVLVSVGTLFGDVWSKVVETAEPFPPTLLAEMETHISERHRGWSLAAVRAEVMRGEPKALLEDAGSLGAAFRLLRKAFEWDEPSDRLVWGRDNLLQIPEFREPEKMLNLMRALEDRDLIPRAMRQGRPVEGGLVAIGSEVDIPDLHDLALVAFPFGWDEEVPGALAVVGPMHMDYGKVVRMVAAGANTIDQALGAGLRTARGR